MVSMNWRVANRSDALRCARAKLSNVINCTSAGHILPKYGKKHSEMVAEDMALNLRGEYDIPSFPMQTCDSPIVYLQSISKCKHLYQTFGRP